MSLNRGAASDARHGLWRRGRCPRGTRARRPRRGRSCGIRARGGTAPASDKGSDEVVFKAMGRAINKTVMVVELIKELELLSDGANVYKLIGPVLVKHDLAETKANVKKHIEYISAELKRMDRALKDLEEKQNNKKESGPLRPPASFRCPGFLLGMKPLGYDV
ncbi:Prefoldin subunit 6 [Zea mays]|uniref:Prefoldin subunit 6 n=1 Tax=Zea mays TaxID=4577 RepID=A0A3L6EW52_MAIZE|nr:Prefoldin subunit 6 [Zea mays]